LWANPGFTNRLVIAVFDNDANQRDHQFDNVQVIALQQISEAAVEDGIENLLPAHVFTEDIFQERERRSGIVGRPKILPELRKTLLCERLCGENANEANFHNFRPYLDRINEIVAPDAAGDFDAANGPADGGPGESSPE
jgi:hypothetical protein